MYFKLLYIAFLLFISSQVNSKHMDGCETCQQKAVCFKSSPNDQYLLLTKNNIIPFGDSFGIVSIANGRYYNIFESCEDESKFLKVLTREELNDLIEQVKKNQDAKISFNDSMKCITIGEIKDKFQKLNKKEGLDQANVLQLNTSIEVYADSIAIRQAGSQMYSLMNGCDEDEEDIIDSFDDTISMQKKLNLIIDGFKTEIRIPLGAGKCITYKNIAEKMIDYFSEKYPEKKTELGKTAIPTAYGDKGLLKYNHEYLKADKCDSSRTMTIWSETEVNKFIEDLVTTMMESINPKLT